MNSKVFIGMSGGVDSAVSALFLKQQGYDVHGIFMKNWEGDDNDPYCSAMRDLTDARAVCEKLNIPLSTINFSQQYWDKVFQYFLDEYAAGHTPNPDVLCNKEIKFRAFLDYALSQDATYIATGHYAQCHNTAGKYLLKKASDKNKDQTYFLHTLNQSQLQYCLFPLGNLNKQEVRAIAQNQGFINYNKKDSTGICFIGERRFKDFLKEYLLAQPGNIETEEGKIIGQHEGLMFYTIGQRKGIGIGGQKNMPENPWYVLEKDIQRRVLIIGQGIDHPQLYKKKLICSPVHWINDPPKLPHSLKAKIRYRQADQDCTVIELAANKLEVIFANPQRAISKGQSVVFYEGETCLGGGIIDEDY